MSGRLLEPTTGPGAPSVVDERVHRFLQQPLLVVDDALRRADLRDLLQPVVPVDDAPVEVVQVGRGKAAAVELDHRPQLRRDDRDGVQDHPLRPRLALDERLGDLQPLDGAGALRALRVGDSLPQLAGELLQVDLLQQLLDGRRRRGRRGPRFVRVAAQAARQDFQQLLEARGTGLR